MGNWVLCKECGHEFYETDGSCDWCGEKENILTLEWRDEDKTIDFYELVERMTR